MERYLARSLDTHLDEALAVHAAILIDGPRACGKTTTALRLAASVARLDVPAQAALFRSDPDAALRAFPLRPLLMDEWQEAPEVIGAVKRAVDAGAPPGSFLLTGSSWPATGAGTWPGTGRIARVTLGPLSVRERRGEIGTPGLLQRLTELALPLPTSDEPVDVVGYLDLALEGGFPEPMLRLSPGTRPGWYATYVDELVQRDLSAIAPRVDASAFRTYLEALALASAGVASHTTIFTAAGITRRTAESYDDLLRRLALADSVPAWTTNRLSQLGSLPKRFIVDPAVLAAAARVGRDDVLRDGGLLGRVIETFVYAQVRSELASDHPRARLHHLRTDKGRHEIDLRLDLGGRRYVAIEVRCTAAPARDDARHLLWLRDQLGEDLVAGVVLHTGPVGFRLDERILALPISTLWG